MNAARSRRPRSALVLAGCSAGGRRRPPPSLRPRAVRRRPSTSRSTRPRSASTGGDTATITVTALDSKNNVVGRSQSASARTVACSRRPPPRPTPAAWSQARSDRRRPHQPHDHGRRDVGFIKKSVAIAVTGGTLTATVGTGTSGTASTIQYTLLDASSTAIAMRRSPSLAGQTDVSAPPTSTASTPIRSRCPASARPSPPRRPASRYQHVTPEGGTTVIPDAAPVTSPSLAANPSSVSTGKQVELRALFIGANNAPIPNVAPVS